MLFKLQTKSKDGARSFKTPDSFPLNHPDRRRNLPVGKNLKKSGMRFLTGAVEDLELFPRRAFAAGQVLS
jgi:hypothetical protein